MELKCGKQIQLKLVILLNALLVRGNAFVENLHEWKHAPKRSPHWDLVADEADPINDFHSALDNKQISRTLVQWRCDGVELTLQTNFFRGLIIDFHCEVPGRD